MKVDQIPREEEFLNWLMDPVTQAYRELLREYRRGLMEQWAKGHFNSENSARCAVANIGAVSQVRQLTELTELTYEQFVQGLSDGE